MKILECAMGVFSLQPATAVVTLAAIYLAGLAILALVSREYLKARQERRHYKRLAEEKEQWLYLMKTGNKALCGPRNKVMRNLRRE